MRFLKIPVFVLLALSLSHAQSSAPADSHPARFSADMLDKSIDPCTNFYAYACTKWKAQNPIPGDRPGWGSFNVLQERGEYIVRDLLQKYSASDTGRSPIEQKIGDYYQACMDENAIEHAGLHPLDSDLKTIADIRSKHELAKEAIHLHRLGVSVLFDFSSGVDFKDATQVIADADQGGMALPDRDYYVKDDPKSVELRKQYLAHVQKMFELMGDPAEKAAGEAKTVMTIETALANGALDRTSRRDPNKVYHKMTPKELAALNPEFSWDVYLEGIGTPPIQSLNVDEPEFFKHLDSVLKSTSLDDLKTYLRFHLVHTNAAMLSAKFVNENFDFFDKTLSGTKELSPRWKR